MLTIVTVTALLPLSSLLQESQVDAEAALRHSRLVLRIGFQLGSDVEGRAAGALTIPFAVPINPV